MKKLEYVVTLHKGVDIHRFYHDMETTGGDACVPDRACEVCRRRPVSRNTHYWLTEQEAAKLKHDERVIAVMLTPDQYGAKPKPVSTNYTPYTITGNFRKDGVFIPSDKSWAHLHCAGNSSQRRKDVWGSGTVNDTVTVFNNGAGVDVVIVDSAMSHDHTEWLSPSTGKTRFVQYQWLNELNQHVSMMDDDGIELPTGTLQYLDSVTNVDGGHGTHVGGTVAGAKYGWANEATIYNLDIFGSTPIVGQENNFDLDALLVFDYLRAFHKHKGNNRPTITNHSWGYSIDLYNSVGGSYFINGDIDDVEYIMYDDGLGNVTRYDAENPPSRGWNFDTICQDLGIDGTEIPYDYPALRADVEDAIEDGVVIIGAAGNENYYCTSTDNQTALKLAFRWNDINPHRGMSPNNADGVICVGALKHTADFKRTDFSNYGPMIDVFAPGEKIVSSWVGSVDAINDIRGTSMASPQVAGVAACLATGKSRFTNKDVMSYIKNHCVHDDMTFNLGKPASYVNVPGDFCDMTCQNGSPNTYLAAKNPRSDKPISDTNVGFRESQPQAYPRPNTMFRNIS